MTSLVTIVREGPLFGHAHGVLLGELHLKVAISGGIRPCIVVARHTLTPPTVIDATIATTLTFFSHTAI